MPHFAPSWQFGGVVRDTYESAKRLAEKGHHITVFTTNANTLYRKIEVKNAFLDGMHVTYFPNWSNYLAIKYKIILPRGLKSQLEAEVSRYDLIHVQGIHTIMTSWSYEFATMYQKPFLISARGEFTEPPLQNHRFLKKILYFLIYKAIKGANTIIAQTKAEKTDCRKFGLEKISIIGAGINISEYETIPPKDIFRRKRASERQRNCDFVFRSNK